MKRLDNRLDNLSIPRGAPFSKEEPPPKKNRQTNGWVSKFSFISLFYNTFSTTTVYRDYLKLNFNCTNQTFLNFC